MDWKEKLSITREQLDYVSPSFCSAKWLQVTLHLHNGYNHSCHHPPVHKIDQELLKNEPSSLHNTPFKKKQRKLMLEGIRPPECEYCWKVEDNASENEFSDRIIKSSDDWAFPFLKEVSKKKWDQNINPKYIEVNFGFECNFTCIYCTAEVSSSIFAELAKEGPYPVANPTTIESLRAADKLPIPANKKNIYIDAFWKWFPDVVSDLLVFRITGGEPLINNNTFRVLDYFNENPQPNLELSINSNFCVPEKRFDMFIEKSKNLIEGKKVKSILVYTSIDTTGEQAEYIRTGLVEDNLYSNIELFLTEVPLARVCFMCTFNILSLTNFEAFVKKVQSLKRKYVDIINKVSRVELDTSILHYPKHLCADLAPTHIKKLIWKSYDFMFQNSHSGKYPSGFSDYEINKVKRLGDWLESTIVEINENPYYNDLSPWTKIRNLKADIIKIKWKIQKVNEKIKQQSKPNTQIAYQTSLWDVVKKKTSIIENIFEREKKLINHLSRRRDFYQHIREYDRRKKMNFSNIFPELEKMYIENGALDEIKVDLNIYDEFNNILN
jgi:organic radical activating enzyme